MTSLRRSCWVGLAGSALALASAAAHATTTTYFGTQGPKAPLSSAAPPTLLPSITAPMADFAAKTNLLGGNEFETGSAGFSYSGNTASVSAGSPVLKNGNDQVSAPYGLGRYNMTLGLPALPSGPDRGHWLEASGDFAYRFSSLVSAFAFFGTDFGDFGGTASIDFLSGSSLVYSTGTIANTASDNGGNRNGNLLFFGFTSTVAFDNIVFHIPELVPGLDVLGFDSLMVGTVKGSGGNAPEPGTLALVGLALAGLGVARAKRQRSA